MLLIFGVIWGFMLAAGVSAVGALLWTLQHDPPQAAAQQAGSILDPDEVLLQPGMNLSKRGG